MEIVILDALTLGDVDLSVFERFGNVHIYEYTPKEKTSERIAQADIVITNKVIIGEEELKNAKKLKLICVAATGYNNIDVAATEKRGVVVANVKDYSTESVAQYVFAHILSVFNKVCEYKRLVQEGQWATSKVFTILKYPIYELKGKNIGIIGYGHIGKRVAEIARSFQMNVLVAKVKGRTYNDNFRLPLETVLQQSDILTIHTPLSPLTRDMITYSQLKMMKKSAIIVNAARGGIINEYDLFKALKNGIISYAIVDVLSLEPPIEGNILFSAPNITITPHIAWTSEEARKKLIDGIVNNIEKFLNGEADKIKVK